MVQKKDEQPKQKAPRLRKKSSDPQPLRDHDPLRDTERMIESAITSVLRQDP
jgi:hypothetical protein